MIDPEQPKGRAELPLRQQTPEGASPRASQEQPATSNLQPATPTKEEWVEAGMVADESLSHPAKRTPEQGIKEMQDRICFLEQALKDLNKPFTYTKANAYCDPNEEAIASKIRRTSIELSTAKARLAEYETQLKSRN